MPHATKRSMHPLPVPQCKAEATRVERRPLQYKEGVFNVACDKKEHASAFKKSVHLLLPQGIGGDKDIECRPLQSKGGVFNVACDLKEHASAFLALRPNGDSYFAQPYIN